MNNHVFKLFSLFALLLFCTNINAQQYIKLDNSIVDGEPKAGKLPYGWLSRGTKGYSPPDTQPNATFGVSKQAKVGNTYIGMVTRADNSFEAITQRLKSPLKAGERYKFSCYLARSDSYLSARLQNPHVRVQYNQAIKLRILGANTLSGDYKVLDETPAIDHEEWEEYTFDLKPKKDYNYIILQAFWVTPYAYRGNVLIDDCSVITCVSCPKPKESKKEAEKEVEEVLYVPEENKFVSTQTDFIDVYEVEQPDNEVDTPKNVNNDMDESVTEPDTISKNSIIKHRIDSLSKIIHFGANSAEITDNSAQSLDEIYIILKNNPNLIIEVGGHTNLIISESEGKPLSKRRAESVKTYLIQKGIDKEHISAKGYGGKKPISKKDKQINQRVEIVILKYE